MRGGGATFLPLIAVTLPAYSQKLIDQSLTANCTKPNPYRSNVLVTMVLGLYHKHYGARYNFVRSHYFKEVNPKMLIKVNQLKRIQIAVKIMNVTSRIRKTKLKNIKSRIVQRLKLATGNAGLR